MADFNVDWKHLAAIVGVGAYTIMRDAESEPLKKRVAKTAASGLLAYGVSGELAAFSGFPDNLTAVIVMALGIFVLDAAAAIIKDRNLLKDIIRKRLGKGGDE